MLCLCPEHCVEFLSYYLHTIQKWRRVYLCSMFTKLIISKNLNVINRRYLIQTSVQNSVIFWSVNSNYQKSSFAVVGGTLVKLARWQGSKVLPSAYTKFELNLNFKSEVRI